MKHLKSYKLFELQISGFDESDVKDVFESYINWNLIEDTKNMSLEYIDEGMSLGVEISYINHYVYYIRYDHTGIYNEWEPGSFNNLTEGPYELEPIDRNKIIYQFYLEKNGMIEKESDKELELRVKEAYPDENINPKYSFSDIADKLVNESIKSPNINDYLDLLHILQDDVFDSWNINAKTDESFEDGVEVPTNKFWSFITYGSKDILSSNPSDFNKIGKIDKLIVYNIGELEIESFMIEFNEDLINYIRESLGYDLIISQEETYNEDYDCYFYDIEFKLK